MDLAQDHATAQQLNIFTGFGFEEEAGYIL
jgi:hypothetical protein